MKLKITAALLALSGSCFAATVTLSSVGSNYDGTDDYGILQSNGTTPVAVGAGVARAGFFATYTDAQVLTLATEKTLASLTLLFADFQTITSDDFSGINSAYGPNAGFVSGGVSNYNAAGRNNTLYSYISVGNLATGDFGLFKSNLTLIPDQAPPALEANYALNFQDGTAILGGYGADYQVAYTGLGAAPTSVNSFVLTTLVPEPSAALLGAIGALGLLRRRRN